MLVMNVNTEIIGPPKEDIFKSGKFRSFIVQSIVMILVISFITENYYIVLNGHYIEW